MNKNSCYLCGSSADANRQEYGTRVIVRCQQCGYYEIENAAINHIQGNDFGDRRRTEFRNTVSEINRRGAEAEIVLSGDMISAREKPKR